MSRAGIAGLVTLVTSLVLFALTLDLKQNPLVPIGPGFYPRIVLGVTAVLAAALLAFDLFAKETAGPGQGNRGLVLAVFAIFGVYVGLLPYLGFRVATLLFMPALQATIEPPKSPRAWIVVTMTAIATTVLAYFLFERQLSVLLPRGRWTGF